MNPERSNTLFSLSFLVLTACSFGPADDGVINCADHKTGKWIVEGHDEMEYWVMRTETHQTEYEVFMGDASKTKSEIKWISDCEYLVFNREQLEGLSTGRTDTLLVTISGVQEDSYLRTVTKYHNPPAGAEPTTQRMVKLW